MNQPAATALDTQPPDTAASQPSSPAEASCIATRFGELVVDPEKIITFAQGLYGLEQHRRFMLTEVPGWPSFFKLLQAVDDPRLSLIVLPFEGGDGPIDPADFDAACQTLRYDPGATAVVGIVTMRDGSGDKVFTVNLKAPLLIDSQRRSGRQHVFASDKYPLRHPLQANDQTRD